MSSKIFVSAMGLEDVRDVLKEYNDVTLQEEADGDAIYVVFPNRLVLTLTPKVNWVDEYRYMEYSCSGVIDDKGDDEND